MCVRTDIKLQPSQLSLFTMDAKLVLFSNLCMCACECYKLPFSNTIWGRSSSVGSVWARCPQCRGFDPPLGTFSGRGDFSLGVNMGSNSIPPKTPSDESIN